MPHPVVDPSATPKPTTSGDSTIRSPDPWNSPRSALQIRPRSGLLEVRVYLREPSFTDCSPPSRTRLSAR